MLRLLGVEVEWRGMHHLPEGRHVLVSNHVTTGDLLSLYRLPHRYIHLVSPALPQALSRVGALTFVCIFPLRSQPAIPICQNIGC